jgi:aryl carrier-like protein
MIGIEEFADLVRDEMGLPVTAGDLALGFDELPGWDSVHLLSLLTLLERATGSAVSLADVLEAPSLEAVYKLALVP